MSADPLNVESVFPIALANVVLANQNLEKIIRKVWYMKIQGTIQEDSAELFWNDPMGFNWVCHDLNERMWCTVDIDPRRVMGMI
jgi:hypothetical protein